MAMVDGLEKRQRGIMCKRMNRTRFVEEFGVKERWRDNKR